jgi:hypothetical protein
MLTESDTFTTLLFDAAPHSSEFGAAVKEWYFDVTRLIGRNLTELETGGRWNELAKWFAREFRNDLERLPEQGLASLGVSLDAIPLAQVSLRKIG